MKKRISVLLSLATLFIYNSYGQIDSYDLSSFKLPALKSQRLNFELSLNNNKSVNNRENSILLNQNLKYSSFLSSLNGYYNYYINSPKYQSITTVNTNFDFNFVNEGHETENQWEDDTSIKEYESILTGSNNTKYFINKKMFLSAAPSIYMGFIGDTEKIIAKDGNGTVFFEETEKVTVDVYGATVDIGLGYGRVEQINFAQMALYILKDLRKADRLMREPTHEEITKFAELMAIKKSETILDSRHRLISEVKALDSLLNTFGIINQSDAIYFTTIYDNWQYAINPIRNSGYRFSAGPATGYSHNFLEPTNEYHSFIPNYLYQDE